MYGVLDIETDKWNDQATENHQIAFKFGVLAYFDGKTKLSQHIFHNIEELLQAILPHAKTSHKKNILRIYVHNLDFDIMFLVNWFKAQHFDVDYVSNGLMLYFKVGHYIKKKNAKGELRQTFETMFEFRNSLCLLPMNLAAIGKMVGLPKLEQDYTSEENPEFLTYCARDCEIVAHGLTELCNMFHRWGLEKTPETMNLTIASMSFALFQKKNSKYKNEHGKNSLLSLSDCINEKWRKFYFGGRTEVFDVAPHHNVACYDVNSLYPDIMMNNQFPIPPYIETGNTDISNDTFAVKACINESHQHIPIIPERLNGKVVFRAGVKEFWLQIEEYNYLKSQHIEMTINGTWECAAWGNIFDYMRQIYKEKADLTAKKNPGAGLRKLPMNSTYGKFAQKAERNKTDLLPIDDLTDENIEKWQTSGWKIDPIPDLNIVAVHKSIRSDVMQINLPIACRITALARLKLTKSIRAIIGAGFPVYYCDTDSIFVPNVPEIGDYIQIDENLMGAFKLEHKLEEFQAYSVKEYRFTEDKAIYEKCKGVISKNNQLQLPGESRLKEYYETHLTVIRPAKLAESLSRKLPVGTVLAIEKSKRSYFDKRWILPDGSSEPLVSDVSPAGANRRIIAKLCNIDLRHRTKEVRHRTKEVPFRYFKKPERLTQYLHEWLIKLDQDYLKPVLERCGVDVRLSAYENYMALKAELRSDFS